MESRRRRRAVLAGTVLVLAAVAAAGLVLTRPTGIRITAYFNQAVSVYPGSDLRILGVRVGRVDSVRPQGQQVEVTLSVNHGVAVPAGAAAVVVAPSVVSDRYVQLTPAYTGGPRMADGQSIPVSRTATPVEIDQLFASIDKLATALGPNGANKNGALSDALNTGAANLLNNGQQIGEAIREFGKAAGTLNGNSGDLFATLTNLQKFTTMLKGNDGQVRTAEQQLAAVNGFLADDRANLASALRDLATALAKIDRFIHDNRALLKSNVGKLASVTQTLVDERRSLAEAFDVIPLTTDNVLNAYDPAHRTLNGRGDLNELSMGPPLTQSTSTPQSAASQVCSVTSGKALASLCDRFSLGAKDLRAVSPSQRAGLPPLPLPPVGTVYGTGGHR